MDTIETDKDDFVTRIYNCYVLKHDTCVFKYEDLWIKQGKFIDAQHAFYVHKLLPKVNIDAEGCYVVPGLIDLQLNGGFGVDFTADFQNTRNNLEIVSKKLLKLGVTAYCPTIVLSEVQPFSGNHIHGAEIIGLHLEGPFISEKRYGAHNINTLKQNVSSISDIYSVYGENLSSVSIITLAPELNGINELIPKLKDKIRCVSLGHTNSTIKQAEDAIRMGATMVTHMFNAMQQFHHRDPGLIGILGSTAVKRPFYGVICDGIHAHPNSVKIAYYSHPEGMVLVTDAMSAMGLPDGDYKLGSMFVNVKNSAAYIKDTNTLAGCSFAEAINAATFHPAKCLKMQNKIGCLKIGCDADFLILDKNINIKRVFVKGKQVNFE